MKIIKILILNFIIISSFNSLLANDSCNVYLEQRVHADQLTNIEVDEIKAFTNQLFEDSKEFKLIELKEEAKFFIELSSLTTHDHYNYRLINIITHTAIYNVTPSKDKMFSYSMAMGKYNRFGNRRKGFSAKNYKKSILNAFNELGNCTDLIKRSNKE